MKTYSLEYQYAMDISWFFLDKNERIAQFNTGGAILPFIIAEMAEENIKLNNFFEELSPSTSVTFNPYLSNYFNINSISSLEEYSFYAKRGMLSFDKTNSQAASHDITYHLIATPEKFLDFRTLPHEIKTILLKTKININLSEFYKVDAGYIPWSKLFKDYSVDYLYESNRKKNFWSFFNKKH